ncbi:MAG: CDP-diacylglycerol--glycerol-3-phosphate 3-phosphatidyltransferase [Planctomycetia bacterium]|nr:CDP-diacylglycerol--glycerol-3-phosphate 3-phosphatidyltransferase [Planctomycetia bacterium]
MAVSEPNAEPLTETASVQSMPRIDRRSLNVPNSITLSRLVLSIVLFAIISGGHSWITAALMFVIAAATDALDGFIARKYGLVTTLGRILDPFADKIIICGAFLFLVAQPNSGVNAWMALIVFGREMFITSLRSFLEQHGRDFSAVWSGKIKMVLQCAAVTGCLLSLDERFATLPQFMLARDVVLWFAVLVTFYSGVEYSWRAFKMLRGDVT